MVALRYALAAAIAAAIILPPTQAAAQQDPELLEEIRLLVRELGERIEKRESVRRKPDEQDEKVRRDKEDDGKRPRRWLDDRRRPERPRLRREDEGRPHRERPPRLHPGHRKNEPQQRKRRKPERGRRDQRYRPAPAFVLEFRVSDSPLEAATVAMAGTEFHVENSAEHSSSSGKKSYSQKEFGLELEGKVKPAPHGLVVHFEGSAHIEFSHKENGETEQESWSLELEGSRHVPMDEDVLIGRNGDREVFLRVEHAGEGRGWFEAGAQLRFIEALR